MDRDSRRLSHGKGSKIVTQSNVPLSSDGDDGDQVMVGSTLYTKSQGRWMPFKSGGGNINDGWHGSQRYIKLLPSDFYLDNESFIHSGKAIYHYDSALNCDPNKYISNQTIGLIHPDANASGVTISNALNGMACSVPVPLGYWAVAVKIYASHTWGPSTVNPAILDGGNESGTTSGSAGIKIMSASLVDGSCTTLTAATYKNTNTRIVLDTAMLGQDSNYLYVVVNGFFPTGAGSSYGPALYGGYVELRRLKTAAVITEEESSTGGDVLERGTGG